MDDELLTVEQAAAAYDVSVASRCVEFLQGEG
jgi:hypothetical protein